ncbi:MAG: PLDc N-terminal domain-containing protein [Actinomycetota bacterium]|nr:PLDc N-terminal domain-containing protein [Actinomycetota bacterium]
MVLFDGFAGLMFIGLWIFCIVDVLTTPASRCRTLPKGIWLLVVLLLVDLGSIAWLVAGHTWDGAAGQRVGRIPNARANRPVASNPDDDEEFLSTLRARAEEQRRQARDTQPRPDDDSGSPST